MSRLESSIEAMLVKRVKERGGKCIKLTGYVGIPDRLVLMPGGRITFVELKTEIGKLSEAQIFWREELNSLGFSVKVINSLNNLEQFLDRRKK